MYSKAIAGQDKLLRLPNAMVTGHQPFLTQGAPESMTKKAVALLTDWESPSQAAPRDQLKRRVTS